MHNPGVLLTGKKAGNWYIQTLDALKKNKPHFDYNILQVDFYPINALLPYKMEEAAKLLEPYFAILESRHHPYILANITLHEAVQYFSFTPKYFISIETILKHESIKSFLKTAILGTKFTMNHSYIPSLLPDTKLVPLAEDIQEDIETLRKVYYHSTNKKLAIQIFSQLNDLEIDCYIIACTELALALDDSEMNLTTINLPALQCQLFVQGVFKT